MIEIDRVSLSAIHRKLPDAVNLFICSASFERRCLSVPMALAQALSPQRSLVCVNARSVVPAAENAKALMGVCRLNCERVSLDRGNPVRTADSLSAALSRAFNSSRQGSQTVVVDITTFTHEALLILLRLLQNTAEKRDRLLLAYSPAAEYSVGLPPSEKWLSRGIRGIRSVLGYPGELKPSLKSHLIILPGFEFHRAARLLDAFQPNFVSIGL